MVIKQKIPLLRSSDVTFPCSIMWLADISVRMSQNRICLSKCPDIIVDPAPSDVTRSLHDEPANFVSVPVEGYSTFEFVLLEVM